MSIKVAARASSPAPATAAPVSPRTLDDFDSLSPWTPVTSSQVTAKLHLESGDGGGQALCMDFDFHGVSGYVGITRALSMDYPADYAFDFDWRGNAPANDLQFKLVDSSGDNVWWVARQKQAVPAEWTHVRYKKRHVSKAWGPSPQTELTHSAKLEFTLASGEGGMGTVCFDHLRFTPLQPDDGSPLRAKSSMRDGASLLDFGRSREFGGLTLDWGKPAAVSYTVDASDDGRSWRKLKVVGASDGGVDWLALPESEARYVRVRAADAETKARISGLRATPEPLAFGATTNDFLREIARRSPRGDWPRGFSGEQPYWTIVGVDGGKQQGLVSEDGAIELGKGGPSIEPFVEVDGKRLSWADVTATQSLPDGYLPMPRVQWRHDLAELQVDTFASGVAGNAALHGRYRLRNPGKTPHRYVLELALRPLQVNPPSQFLNTTGGYSPLYEIAGDTNGGFASAQAVGILGPQWKISLASPADSIVARSVLQGRQAPGKRGAWQDADRLQSLAWRFEGTLAPGETREVAWSSPLDAPATASSRTTVDAPPSQSDMAAEWHRKLDVVEITVPPQGQRLVNTLKTALANMLISRQGPRLQPGTRSYARSWIRDGAMINEALLRLGRDDVAREFVRWYAPYQFEDGKVPCCVDDRGSDPVPENDSHGELIYAIAEAYRYTRDRALLEQTWPNVRKAIAYMDQLRLSERTEANRAVNPAFYGMMPASISHEGYSAKAMHSYWDDFWALRGYKDAVAIAQWLGHADEAQAFAASRDQFAGDLRASIVAASASKGIDFIPGAAELGDFDATSTTIALSPADAGDLLPANLLRNTFERYWRESKARADGTRPWKDYTPYELRSVGAFVRLDQPERAQAMLDFFFRHQQPAGWNQWAEVVSSTPRKPFFLGDLPHAWVASDYVRSVLDMFAYARERDGAQVIGAGIPLDWLAGNGVSIANLRTADGPLSYRLRSPSPGRITLDLPADIRLPKGGLALRLACADVRAVRIDGKPAEWKDHEVRIKHVPARVELDLKSKKGSEWIFGRLKNPL